MKKKIAALAIVFSLAATGVMSGCSSGGDAADTVIKGNVYTVDSENSVVQVVAIKDGKISYVGDEAGVEDMIGSGTEVIETEDHEMVMPGFIDGHMQVGKSAGVTELYEADLYDGSSVEDYQKTLKDFIAENPDLEFVRARGWSNSNVPDGGLNKAMLDAVSDEVPIVALSSDAHTYWVNSAALELTGVDQNTDEVKGGIIERDSQTNEPSGVFRDEAMSFVTEIIPDYTVEQYKDAIMHCQKELKQYGLTSYFETMVAGDSVGENLLPAYQELEDEGKLIMRVYAGVRIDPDENSLDDLDKAKALMEENAGGDFTIDAIKVFADGVVESKTALLLDDYDGDPGYQGDPIWEQEDLNAVCEKADQLGLQVHVHAIGDGAVHSIVTAYENAIEKNGENDNRRLTVAHFQVAEDSDLDKMGELGIVASANPYWFCKEPGWFEEIEVAYLGEERANNEYPMKALFDRGIVVNSSSDYPVTIPPNPLQAIQMGITRTTVDGDEANVLNADQCVGIADMLKSVTYNASYAFADEDNTGSLEVGKDANLIILGEDLTDIEPEQIADVQVLKTFYKGEQTFDRK